MQTDKLETVVRDLARTTPQEPGKRSILELRGLGKEIWQGADAQEHVEGLRKEWDQGMFKEHERVVLTTDICGDEGEQLRSGDVGVVAYIFTPVEKPTWWSLWRWTASPRRLPPFCPRRPAR